MLKYYKKKIISWKITTLALVIFQLKDNKYYIKKLIK